MKKIWLVFGIMILLLFSVCYAGGYDTNEVEFEGTYGSSSDKSKYPYWAYYPNTGTRYVIRIYDDISQKFIAVPKEYYINHTYGFSSERKVDTSKEILSLGVNKKADKSYDIVKQGSKIFTDTTYSHILDWSNNPDVKNFGLSTEDVKMLAEIIQTRAQKNGNTTLANQMKEIIAGRLPYEVRAEILFYMKLPGVNGQQRTATVNGKGSIENYSFVFYENQADKNTSKSDWRKEYLTYLEIKAICYAFGDDCNLTMKAKWLDKVACALYEKDAEYVFANGVYQCSCDLYQRKFSNVAYLLNNQQLVINKSAINPNREDDIWYEYYTVGRCGVPVQVQGTTYYITPGKTYRNLAGSRMKINEKIYYYGDKQSIKAQNTDYLEVVTDDATQATIYEGWDYITNKLASTLVIACDKDTGNIITMNQIPYREFENVKAGTYEKSAWEIEGYEYLGYQTRNDLMIPNAPLKIADTQSQTTIMISNQDVEKGSKKQVIFVYQKSKEKPKEQEVRLSLYFLQDTKNTLLYTGSFIVDANHQLTIAIKDQNEKEAYSQKKALGENNAYEINTTIIEKALQIDSTKYVYVGSLIKSHAEYFLTYQNETLKNDSGVIYNLNQVKEEKVHIILGYSSKEDETIVVEKDHPQLKISYLDEKGNPLPQIASITSDETVGEEIVTLAKDLKSEMYFYQGYVVVDSEKEFQSIPKPITIQNKTNSIKTVFEGDSDRRHIAFIYRKIEIKIAIDIEMEPNSLDNQLIGQKAGEDYWVLDEEGKVTLKASISGTEGLTISSYQLQLRIPFDTVMNGELVKANTVNNIAITELSHTVVAESLRVPVWVREQVYDITAVMVINVDGFGTVKSSAKDNVEVVGRLYDFTVTNLDGSKRTGDEKWKTSLFGNINQEYKAKALPVGQSIHQPEQYLYGIKLGTTFYFSVNTKGNKNNAISITPKFLYVNPDGTKVEEVDVYVLEEGKMKNILEANTIERKMKLKDENVLKEDVIEELEKAKELQQCYSVDTTQNRNIGTLSNPIIPQELSLPYVRYVQEFQQLYGLQSLLHFAKTENELLLYASHWYGKYVIPSSAKVVPKGMTINEKEYKGGYLIVCFSVISLGDDGSEYLSYHLPSSETQWQKESLNQLLKLPMITRDLTSHEILIQTIQKGYAPVIIYQVGVSTQENVTTEGTH